MPLVAGQVLRERYRIEATLGQGGMGAVYRATDLTFQAPVAIKENKMIAPESQRQFAREAGLLHQLRHPNLPRVTDHFSIVNEGQYLVMDFVAGEDLNEMVARRGPIPQPQALEWMGQVLAALEYLHGKRIIHRDVKPANVKIDAEGGVFLVDFGLAKVFDPLQETTIGARGVTPGFAPPEQYGQGRTDARTDVYSAGATLYALLTGTAPPDALEVMTQRAHVVLPRQQCPEISPEVESAVLKAMQPVPANRFQTAAALRQSLLEPPTRLIEPDAPPVPPGTPKAVPAALAVSPAPEGKPVAPAPAPSPLIAPRVAPESAPPAPSEGWLASVLQRLRDRPAWLLAAAAVLVAVILWRILASGGGRVPPSAPTAASFAAVAGAPSEQVSVRAAATWTETPVRKPTGTPTPTQTPEPGALLLPDLVVDEMRIMLVTGPYCGYTSTQLGLFFSVANAGPGDAGPFVVEANGQRQAIPGAASGEAVSFWIDSYNQPGENTVVADVDSQVEESDEGNNSRSQMLPIPTLPPTCTPEVEVGEPESTVPALLLPAAGAQIGGLVTFTWSHTWELEPGQAFRVIMWKDGDSHYSAAAAATGEMSQGIDLDAVPLLARGGPGEYLWSVVVVDENSGLEVGPVSRPRPFDYAGRKDQPDGGSSPLGVSAGRVRVRDADGMEMVFVPRGEFLMGSGQDEPDAEFDEKPQHPVLLDSYYIDKTEVTISQYRACVEAGVCRTPECDYDVSTYYDRGKEAHPVVCVSWHDATAYCEWVGSRLPTEAEWEKAARGTDARRYPWGNTHPGCNRAQYDQCGGNRTIPVGSKPDGASPYGALDMAGNVWEWVADIYDQDYYYDSPLADPEGPVQGTQRVLRGGSWSNDRERLRSADRYMDSSPSRHIVFGFRCAQDAPPER